MNNSVTDIRWLPRDFNCFMTWGNEINLYEVKRLNNNQIYADASLELSNTTCAALLATETKFQHIRCVCTSYQQTSKMLAIGLANGKVGLCNFMACSDNNMEFTPKQSRACTCLAWHEIDTNILAIGHDRYRSDNCITIWDTERGVSRDKAILNVFGLSETAHSICWQPHSKLLIAGMSYKYIKLIDLKQPNVFASVANTRSVHGVTVAPNERILASYIDNLISIWDIRNIEKPVTTLQTEKNIIALNWCTTRSNTLTTIQRDSPYIHLIDLHWPSGEIEAEPHTIKRQILPFQSKLMVNSKNTPLTSLSWHPNDVERVLVLTKTGLISDFKIQQRVAISWDPYNNLCSSIGINLNYINTKSPAVTLNDSLTVQEYETIQSKMPTTDDIADLIYQRTLMDYGKLQDIQKNGDLTQNPMLKSAWKLLATMNEVDNGLNGLKTVLGISNFSEGLQMTYSESVNYYWPDLPTAPPMKMFRSAQRDFAIHLCGWNFDKNSDESFDAFIDELCDRQEFTKAALIAGFQLKIRLAIEILVKGAKHAPADSNNLSMAAIALSGLHFEKSTLWRSQFTEAHNQIKDPHLRALFAFLSPENDSYEDVLRECDLSVSDRMAFACKFLCDNKLAEYIKDMIKICIELGDLNGLLLTGLTNEGIQLLQRYLNRSDDVQTVALISMKFLPKELITDYAVQYWISSYRELLDVWGLWEQRAHFDVTMGQTRSPPRYSRSVFLQCSFCGKSVSATLHEQISVRTTSSGVNKLSSCPNCHKPLPRCSLCLLHMGTSTAATAATAPSINQNDNTNCGWQSKPFSKWFSWCQTCRHGGHTEHLSNWFNENVECPVASCTCKCMALDMSIPKFPQNYTLK